MRVALFGLGYVGSVTAACLAKAGHEVVGVDISAEKVAMVNAATPPVVEPGLAELLAEVVGAGRLRATTSSDEAVAASDLSLICVGTPGRSNGQLDVDAVIAPSPTSSCSGARSCRGPRRRVSSRRCARRPASGRRSRWP